MTGGDLTICLALLWLMGLVFLTPARGEVEALPEGVVFQVPPSEALATVPWNEQGVVVDGTMEEQEWLAASAFTGFTDQTARGFSARQTVVYACYDQDSLYFAFRSAAPADPDRERIVLALQPRADLYLFSLSPTNISDFRFPISDFPESEQSPIANRQSKIAPVSPGPRLKGEVEARSTFPNGQWVCEVKIPFAAFGAGPPADGETWPANFARIFEKPFADTTWANRWGNDPRAFAPGELGRLVFRREGPYLQVTSLGRIEQGRLRVTGTLAVKPGQAAALKKGDMVAYVFMPLEARGNTTEYGQGVYYQTGEVTKFSLVTYSYAGAEGLVEDERIGTTRRAGDSVASLTVRYPRWDGTTLLRTERYPAGRPFDRLYLYSCKGLPDDKIVFWLETYGIKSEEAGRLRLKVETELPEGNQHTGKVLESKEIRNVQPGEYELEFNSGRFEVGLGTYGVGKNRFRAVLTDEHGQQVAKVERDLEKPDASLWQGRKVGISEKVPAPFEPVRREGNSVFCWGREYALDEGCVMARIVTRDRSILAGPVVLEATSAGNPIRFQGSAWEFEEVKETAAVASTTLASPQLDLAIRHTIEYDGMVRVDTTLRPKAEGVQLDGLVLRIPVQAGHAKYLNWNRGGSQTDPAHYSYGALPAEGFEGDFRGFLWVGDEDRGLLWFAESMKNWSVQEKQRVLKVEKQGGIVEMRVTLIDRPTSLDQPTTITFGLQASPVRPRPARWRGFARKLSLTGTFLSGFNSYNPVVVVQEAERLRKMKREQGENLALYCYPHFLATAVPAYTFFAHAWKRDGPASRDKYLGGVDQMDAMCIATGFADFHVWFEKEALELDPNRHVGLLYDIPVAQTCRATNHPDCTYVDAEGVVQPKLNIFALREFYKRIYTLFRERMEETCIIAHSSANSCQLPLFSFVDALWDGEQYGYATEDYCTQVPPDRWRAELTCRQFGPVPLTMPILRYISPDESATYTFASMVYLHDTVWGPGFSNAAVKAGFEKVREEFGIAEPDVEFIPYWEGQGKVFSAHSPEVLISAYTRPGKVLIVVGNLGDREVEDEITVDFRSLQVEPGVVRVFDGESSKTLPVENGRIRVSVKAKRPVLITVN